MPNILLFVVAVIGASSSQVFGQHDLNQLPGRSVIAHMFEWRFKEIAHECENWLGPMGYGAVQVGA